MNRPANVVIDNRKLNKEQLSLADTRFLRGRQRASDCPVHLFGEVCWSDDFTRVRVGWISGVMEYGISDAMRFDGLRPYAERGHHYVYLADSHPAVREVLDTIRDVLAGWPGICPTNAVTSTEAHVEPRVESKVLWRKPIGD